MQNVYMDHTATTPVSPEVLKAMTPYFSEFFGNPSSVYSFSKKGREAIEKARGQVAAALNAEPSEIFFTGSGTEADNWALKGTLERYRGLGKDHLVTTKIEHHAILHTAQALQKEGFDVVYLPVDGTGTVELDRLERAIDEDTALVSIMTANNEVGTIEPIAEIGKLCHSKGVYFHTDAVQAFGHIPIDVREMNIDLLSLSGHKINAPKGVGAIYIRSGIMLEPLITGGGQERNRRSGTENVASIVGLGEAARLKALNMEKESAYVRGLAKSLREKILSTIPQTILTGHPENRLPGNSSFAIAAIEGETMVMDLNLNGICAATGSACSTASLDPSHVLLAIGLSHETAHGSLRITLDVQNTPEDVDYIAEKLSEIVARRRAMSPVWKE